MPPITNRWLMFSDSFFRFSPWTACVERRNLSAFHEYGSHILWHNLLYRHDFLFTLLQLTEQEIIDLIYKSVAVSVFYTGLLSEVDKSTYCCCAKWITELAVSSISILVRRRANARDVNCNPLSKTFTIYPYQVYLLKSSVNFFADSN